MKISVCSGCVLGSGFGALLAPALAQAGIAASVGRIDCMSGCARPSTVAFRSPGKTAYLFGDLTDNDLDSLVNFARLYAASDDGSFADARVLGDLRAKAIARIPG